IEDTAKVRESGQALGEFLKQQDLLSRRPPVVEALIRALYDKKGERIAARDKVAAALMNYADRAIKQRLDQGMLFGDAPAAPERLLVASEEAAGEVAELRPSVDMFGLRPQTRTEPAVRAAEQALARNPNIEVATDEGPARGRSELLGADEALDTSGKRAPDALNIAADCAGQRAA
ncbi:MAG: hypothetical protein ACREQD_17480, partial [Candidatus Binataceae bacterium]